MRAGKGPARLAQGVCSVSVHIWPGMNAGHECRYKPHRCIDLILAHTGFALLGSCVNVTVNTRACLVPGVSVSSAASQALPMCQHTNGTGVANSCLPSLCAVRATLQEAGLAPHEVAYTCASWFHSAPPSCQYYRPCNSD